MPRLALIGDYSPSVTAHQAIPIALALARDDTGADLTWDWIHTSEIQDAPSDLASFAAVWVVPASPYANTAGALDAIRFARETRRPFLGTCGGFQHAVIEFARHVAGLAGADHAETNPSAPTLLVTPLACSLVEQTTPLRFVPGSLVHAAYGADAAVEGYHCNFGPNPAHVPALERAGLRFTAFDGTGEPRAAELAPELHPFFVGTLFQPERAALRGAVPPLVRAFVRAIAADTG
ncbi:MAG TPA: CTP synthase [Opitutus sp.]|nr:CTP synthase [Opitutus sp.]